MDTNDILKEIKSKNSWDIQYIFLSLLKDKKITFEELSKNYIYYLEEKNNSKDNLLAEASACVISSFMNNKVVKEKKDKGKGLLNWMYTQRCLHFLNITKHFNMEALNKEYGYDKDSAKEYSEYERSKKY